MITYVKYNTPIFNNIIRNNIYQVQVQYFIAQDAPETKRMKNWKFSDSCG